MWISIDDRMIPELLASGGYISDLIERTQKAGAEKDARYLQTAKDNHYSEGDLEFDDGAVVSVSDEGAYVQGWKWISDEEAGVDSYCAVCGAETTFTITRCEEHVI